MARCNRCNKFLLFSTKSGYCANCDILIANENAEKARKAREEAEKRLRDEEEKLQKLTDKVCKEIDEIAANKTKEIMSV